jgi:hypothetical protein
MKLLAALLVFMIAAQPVQAGFCDLDLSGDADPHAAMQHGSESNGSGHECCQNAGSGPDGDSGSNCSDLPCGFCIAGVQAIPPAASVAAMLPTQRETVLSDGQIAPSHTSPPFRPPIFIS